MGVGTTDLSGFTLAEHGAQLCGAAVAPHLDDLVTALADIAPDQPGVRISNLRGLRPYLAPGGAIGSLLSFAMPFNRRAVRAILFDKTAGANWSLTWHQDRTICVRRRIEVAGFGPWSIKAGLQHVAPPFDLLSRMLTLRVHLDDVPTTNAPLLIAPGSHKAGRVPADQVANMAERFGTVACLALAGDVWAYSTPILHASEAASRPAQRRVLQVDFSADELPGGLEWLGV